MEAMPNEMQFRPSERALLRADATEPLSDKSRCIRVSTPADGPAIVALLRNAGLHPIWQERGLHWKYWQKRADWPGDRSFVLSDGSQILGHVAIVPGACTWGHQRAAVVHMIDWAASADAPGAGVALMKHVRSLADAMIATDGSPDTLRVLPVLGFRRYGTATLYVRALHPLRYLTFSAPWNWKTLPKFLISVAWGLAAPAVQCGQWNTRRIMPEQVQSIAAILPSAGANRVVMERSTALFTYLLDCPIATVTLHSVEKAGHIRGYFLLAFVPGQARLVDCWIDSSEPDDWQALVQCAVHVARQAPGIAEVITVASDPLLSGCLRQSGFHARRKTPVQMLIRKGQDGPPECPPVQMLDSDAAYHHHGYPQFWG
jgi:hypothetical protein